MGEEEGLLSTTGDHCYFVCGSQDSRERHLFLATAGGPAVTAAGE